MILSIGNKIYSISFKKFRVLKYWLVPDFDNKYQEHLWTDGDFIFHYPERFYTLESAMIEVKTELYKAILQCK